MAPRQSRAAKLRNYLVPLAVVLGPKQVFAYGRVSTDLQRETETINVQVHKLTGTIAVLTDPSIEEKERLVLAECFWDEGVSGTVPLEERPEGRRMVGAICSRNDIKCDGSCLRTTVVDQVWITKLDRLARSLQILLDIELFLRRHNVWLRCMSPSIDTSTPEGRLVFGVLAIIAQWEREVILERTTGGKHQKAREGKWVGGRMPFGLKTDESGHLVVDDTLVERAGMAAYEVVQSVFENIALHGSTVWKEAQRVGMSDRRVGLMLHNRRYKGEGGIYNADGEWTDATANKPPAVISPALWDLAQEKLKYNRKNSSGRRHYHYLLSNLIVCCEPFDEGICGRTFAGRIEHRHKYNVAYAYYFCSRTCRVPGMPSQAGCTAKMLRVKDTEDRVWAEVKAVLADPQQYMLDAADDARNGSIDQLRNEIADTVDKLARLNTERDNVLRSGEQGLRPLVETEARARELIERSQRLQEHRAALELQLRSYSLESLDAKRAAITTANIAADLDEIERTNDVDAKDALIHAVVKRIEVRTVDGTARVKLVLRLAAQIPDLHMEPRSHQQASDHPQPNVWIDDNLDTLAFREYSVPLSSRGHHSQQTAA